MLIGAWQVSAQQLPADSLGQMSLSLPVDSAFVVIDRDFRNPVLVTREDSMVTLPIGQRHITVSFPDHHDQPFLTEIAADTINVVRISNPLPLRTTRSRLLSSSFPRLAWRANLAIHGDHDADIFVDGERVGMAVAHVEVPAGRYDVVTILPDGRRQSSKVFVRDSRITIADQYIRPSRSAFIGSAFFPGGGQIYRGDYYKGAAASVVVLGSATGALITHFQAKSLTADLIETRRSYNAATTEPLAWELGNHAASLSDQLNTRRRTRNILLGVSTGAYIIQLVDAIWPPSGGFRRAIDGNYLINPTVGPDGPGLRFQLEINQ